MEQRSVYRTRRWVAVLAAAFVGVSASAQTTTQPAARPAAESRALGIPKAGPTGTSVAAPSPSLRTKSESGSAWGSGGTVRTALSLAGVLGLALVGTAAMKIVARNGRLGLASASRAPAGVMEVLGRYPIGRGVSLVLLKLDRRILLLSQSVGGRIGSGSGVTTLCEVTDPDEIASILLKSRDAEGDSLSERFRSLLSRFDRGMDTGVVEVPQSRRRVASTVAGDRTEIWNDAADQIPVVDLTRRPGEAAPAGAIGSLRRRLAAFRSPETDGGDRA